MYMRPERPTTWPVEAVAVPSVEALRARALESLFRDHLVPAFERIHSPVGVSEKLIWTTVAECVEYGLVTRRGWLLFSVMCVVWGIPYLFIKVAVGGVAPPVVVFARTAGGAAILLPVAALTGRGEALRVVRQHWRAAGGVRRDGDDRAVAAAVERRAAPVGLDGPGC